VGLQPFGKADFVHVGGLREDLPGQDHPCRLAPDASRPDQPIVHGQKVVQVDVSSRDLHELRAGPEGHTEQVVPQSRLLGAGGVREVVPCLFQLAHTAVKPVPRRRPRRARRAQRMAVERGEKLRRLAAFEQRNAFAVRVHVRQEHRRAVAVQGLQRVKQHMSVVVKHVHEHLRCVADAGNGLVHVLAPHQCEIGDRIELVQVGACHPEEVRQRVVRLPVGYQPGQTVEDVEHLPAELRDAVVDLLRERVEAHGGVDLHHFHSGEVLQHRIVTPETHIDQPVAGPLRLRRESLRQAVVVPHIVHLPDDVVSRQDGVQHPVDRCDSRRWRCCHGLLPIAGSRKGCDAPCYIQGRAFVPPASEGNRLARDKHACSAHRRSV